MDVSVDQGVAGGPEGERPEAELSQGEPPEGEQSPSERPQGEPSQGERPQGEPSQSERPQGEPSQSERPQGEPSQSERPQGESSRDERPEARLEQAVRVAEQALIEFEIAVETFRVEVENFSRLHHQRLGPMYTRLDELDARIAEARAAQTGDPEDLRRAQEARAAVMPMPGVDELFHDWVDSDGISAEAAAMLTDRPVQPPKRVRPSDEVRKLYRELARQAHPDLAREEGERQRREEFITRVNAAYARGDEALLRELSEEWAAGPVPEVRLSESEELYARLEWLSQRKEMLSGAARELEDSAIGAMLRMAPDDPDRLLEEIAEQLLAQVAEREAELAVLVRSVQ